MESKINKTLKNFFVDELDLLCKKYDISISHEDVHGAFIIENYSAQNIEMIRKSINNLN